MVKKDVPMESKRSLYDYFIIILNFSLLPLCLGAYLYVLAESTEEDNLMDFSSETSETPTSEVIVNNSPPSTGSDSYSPVSVSDTFISPSPTVKPVSLFTEDEDESYFPEDIISPTKESNTPIKENTTPIKEDTALDGKLREGHNQVLNQGIIQDNQHIERLGQEHKDGITKMNDITIKDLRNEAENIISRTVDVSNEIDLLNEERLELARQKFADQQGCLDELIKIETLKKEIEIYRMHDAENLQETFTKESTPDSIDSKTTAVNSSLRDSKSPSASVEPVKLSPSGYTKEEKEFLNTFEYRI